MIYTILKFLIKCSAELFYSKHKLIHFDQLETNKPLIICANHASAHLDGILIMIYSKRKYYVLVRADIFNKPWLAKLLAKINLIPIYRMRDGIKNLDKNSETFTHCINILKNNGAVIIFPEANCIMERKLRPLHKGAAKIAFMAEEESHFKLGVQICTVGISQERLAKPGGRLFMEASKPFDLSDFKEQYQENSNKAFTSVMQKVEHDLRTVLPVIEERKDEKLFEELLLQLNIRDNYNKWKTLAKSINTADEELKDVLKTAIHDFKKHLRRRNLDINTVSKLSQSNRLKRLSNLALYLIDVVAMFPFFILGLVFNILPFALPSIISNTLFRKDKEYINGTHMVIGVLLFLISYIVYGFVFYALMQNIISVVISLFIVALCGIMAYHYKRRLIEFTKALSFELSRKSQKQNWYKQSQILNAEFKQWLSN